MDFLCRLMPVAGMGLLLFLTPILVLITLVFAAIAEKMSGTVQNLGYFIGYLLWLCIGMGGILILPFGNSQWWLVVLLFWLLLGSIPHGMLYIKGRKSKNRVLSLTGASGFAATITATTSIGLLCYSARFF